MNIQNKPKQIVKIASELDVPEWQIHKAIYELNTGDEHSIRKYFRKNDLTARLQDMAVRIEEVHVYLMQTKSITAEEFTRMNVRLGHLKTDCKQMIEDYIEIKPNELSEIKAFIREGLQKIDGKFYDHDDFVFKLDMLLTEAKKIVLP